MRKIARAGCPASLVEKGDEWTMEWERRVAAEPGCEFRWPQYQKERLNKLLETPLGEMTQEHCAFCDGPFVESHRTIEHFKPKKRFPGDAYKWDNLFPACSRCQNSKMDNWDELLLKPDDTEYKFHDYFFCDVSSGKIEPNPAASSEERARAKATVKIYDLNAPERKSARRHELKGFLARKINGEDIILDEFNYRFFIEACALDG